MAAILTVGYVVTEYGQILAQVPDSGPAGFALIDDDQTWPGGFGLGTAWNLIADDDPRITDDDRARLEWLVTGGREHVEHAAAPRPFDCGYCVD